MKLCKSLDEQKLEKEDKASQEAHLQLADAAEAVLVEARQRIQLRHRQLLQPRAHQRPDAGLRHRQEAL